MNTINKERGEHMLYYVKRGDTLNSIAKAFNISIEDIQKANVICNPNFITIGEPLIIPEKNMNLPKSQGEGPYYITQYGDTYWCLSKEFNIPIKSLVYMNKLNPNFIPTGYELLIGNYLGNPEKLKAKWNTTGKTACDTLTQEQVHDIYYNGSFIWQALGYLSISYLLELLKNPCDIVRFYSIVSLGRIAPNSNRVIAALNAMINDPSELVSNAANLALRRIELVQKYNKRMHVTIVENRFFDEPNLKSKPIILPIGSDVMSLNWAIPSPTGEKDIFGNILLYDRVLLLNTGQNGYIPRLGLSEINVI